MSNALWRPADARDDDSIIDMCLALNREDPGTHPVVPEQVRRTLDVFRREPARGAAIMLDVDGDRAGYAFPVSFWSNERGGEACVVDELFVIPSLRSRGHGAALFAAIEDGSAWERRPVSIELGVSASNQRARALYERLGFEVSGTSLSRLLDRER